MPLNDACQEIAAALLALLQAVLLGVLRLLLAVAAFLDGAVAALLGGLAALAVKALNDEALASCEVAEATRAIRVPRASADNCTATATATGINDARVINADERSGAGGSSTAQLPLETAGPTLRGVFETVADEATTTLLSAALAVLSLTATLPHLRAHCPALAAHPGLRLSFPGTERGSSEGCGHTPSHPAQRRQAVQPGGIDTPDQFIKSIAVHRDASFHVRRL
ncbi:MAG TPA: hypothetical protein VE420_15960 [Gemmatimonadales bacterium]|nr:hypothetical protein [Gemmatimonadales bacterium]